MPDFGHYSAIPLSLKLIYTLFVVVLVPVYWRFYGPSNFLWFSDLALLIGLLAVWLESPLLASMQALSVTFLEIVWLIDFFVGLGAGRSPIGLTAYMFDPKVPRGIRALSLFHVAMPVLLPYFVWRLGYDPLALPMQTLLAWAVLLVCYFFTDPARNINWVFGPGPRPQRRISSRLYLLLLMAFFPICVYLPSHFTFQWLVPRG